MKQLRGALRPGAPCAGAVCGGAEPLETPTAQQRRTPSSLRAYTLPFAGVMS